MSTKTAAISAYATAVAEHLREGLEERLASFSTEDPEKDLLSATKLADLLLEAAPRAPSQWANIVGPVYGSRQLETRLGISRQALAERRKRRTILAPRTIDGEFVYPLFQFDKRGQVLDGLAELLQTLSLEMIDDWSLVAWLVEERRELNGHSVMECLRQKRSLDEVRTLVRDARRRFSR